MSNNVIMGSEQSVLNYYLNSQFSTVSKVIITSENFLQNINSSPIEQKVTSFFELSQEEQSQQKEALQKELQELETNEDFYKTFQDKLKSLGKEMDIALKDYNFMSSISNTRYSVTLRTQTTSFSKYFVEKGSIINAMKQLFAQYIFSSPQNQHSWKQFQFECFESEDIYKSVFMKKEHNQLLLYATFGCPAPETLNLTGGGEIYHSIDEKFHFFKNKQEYAYLRQHGVLEKKEINPQEKVLSSGELKVINQATKQIDNVVLELYLTQKGGVQILNVTPNEHPIGSASQNGCVLFKSSKNYNKISLINLKDCGEIETTNPHYLLVKNDLELQEIIRRIEHLPIDGLVFTYNCYHPVIEEMAEKRDLDIIYYDSALQKSLEVSINWEDFSIEGAESKSQDNPFSSILSSEEKEKDQLLEKLKNIDLSTEEKDETQKQEYEQIEQLTQSMTASPNSSQAKMANPNTFANVSSNPGGEKKSAIGMLADAALNKEEQPETQPQPGTQAQSQDPMSTESQPGAQQQDPMSMQPAGMQQQAQGPMDTQQGAQTQSQGPMSPESQTGAQQQGSMPTESQPGTQQGAQVQSQPQGGVNQVQSAVAPSPGNQQQAQGPMATETQAETQQQAQSQDPMNTFNHYSQVLATRLYTPAQIPSQGHIVDSQSLGDVSDEGDIILVVSEREEITNPSLTYALPVYSGTHEQAKMLLSSPHDFLVALKAQPQQEPLLNVSVLEDEIKQPLIEEVAHHYEQFSVIVNKDDIPVLESFIESLNVVYVKDALQEQDLEEIQQIMLAFEKRALMKYLKQ